MRFEEFQLTRVFVDDLCDVDADYVGRAGVVYCGGKCFIEDRRFDTRTDWREKFFLVIENCDYAHDDLTLLERRLWLWYDGSCDASADITLERGKSFHAVAHNAHKLAIEMQEKSGEIEEALAILAFDLSEQCGVDIDAWNLYFCTGAKATEKEAHEHMIQIHIAAGLGLRIPRVADGYLQQEEDVVHCPECSHAFRCKRHFGECPRCGCKG